MSIPKILSRGQIKIPTIWYSCFAEMEIDLKN